MIRAIWRGASINSIRNLHLVLCSAARCFESWMVIEVTVAGSSLIALFLKFGLALLLGSVIAIARLWLQREADCNSAPSGMTAGGKSLGGTVSTKRKKAKANKSKDGSSDFDATCDSGDVAADTTGHAEAAARQEEKAVDDSHAPLLDGDMDGSLEPWEVPLLPADREGPPTDTEKALLRVTKKLREVKIIEASIRNGEVVEQNRLAKAQKRPELVEEWIRLRNDVEWERGHSGQCSRQFVVVRPGVAASRLRSEASKLVEEVQDITIAESAGTAVPAAAAAAVVPAQKSKSAKRRARKAAHEEAIADDDAGWITVSKSKEKLRQEMTEEERAARAAAHKARQAMKVQNELSDEYRLTLESVGTLQLFSPSECEEIEALIEQVVIDARRGLFKERTVDLTPMRNKYFFGFAYTYGAQREHPGAHGVEAVWPPEETSEVPAWIQEKLIAKLEARRAVPKGWINSAVINDYAAGGCIVSHIDPPHLFDRPIFSVSFFSDCNLVFGTRFAFPHEADIETTTPVLVHRCLRGCGTVLKGYSANKITHAIRPCDLPSRRAAIILRRVLPTAPVLTKGKMVPLAEHLKQRDS